MTYYTCGYSLEAMLSCIYEAWASRKGHRNIRLVLEPVEQYTLFDEYIHVDADEEKAQKVADSLCRKISPEFYRELIYTYMAYEPEALDNIYRCMILGFAYGDNALRMMQYRDVMRHRQIYIRLGKEINSFQEFMRFHKVGEEVYVAHFEPKSRIAAALGPIFQDRMPSEHWMIIDDIHREAVIHPRDEDFYMRRLTDAEYHRLLETEEYNDEYTQLWKSFFNATTIKERRNEKCQRNHFPLWARKHAVEFE